MKMNLENDLMNIGKIEPLTDLILMECEIRNNNLFDLVCTILNDYFNNNTDDNINNVKRLYKQILKECVNKEITPSSFVINVLWDYYFGVDEKEI